MVNIDRKSLRHSGLQSTCESHSYVKYTYIQWIYVASTCMYIHIIATLLCGIVTCNNHPKNLSELQKYKNATKVLAFMI